MTPRLRSGQYYVVEYFEGKLDVLVYYEFLWTNLDNKLERFWYQCGNDQKIPFEHVIRIVRHVQTGRRSK